MELLLADCQAFVASSHGVWLSVLLAGFMASITHCSLMCAPMVAAQLLTQDAHGSRQMIRYHAGRITTYMLLGGAAALASAALFSALGQELIHLMLLLAGGMFIYSALKPAHTHKNCHATHRVQRFPLYLRGMLMGLMPCGMIVAALLMVSATASPLEAVLAMGVFGLATSPMLQLAGATMARIGQRISTRATLLGRALLIINGFWLSALGLNLVHLT